MRRPKISASPFLKEVSQVLTTHFGRETKVVQITLQEPIGGNRFTFMTETSVAPSLESKSYGANGRGDRTHAGSTTQAASVGSGEQTGHGQRRPSANRNQQPSKPDSKQ